jgi:hypothetical protein
MVCANVKTHIKRPIGDGVATPSKPSFTHMTVRGFIDATKQIH